MFNSSIKCKICSHHLLYKIIGFEDDVYERHYYCPHCGFNTSTEIERKNFKLFDVVSLTIHSKFTIEDNEPIIGNNHLIECPVCNKMKIDSEEFFHIKIDQMISCKYCGTLFRMIKNYYNENNAEIIFLK